MERRKVFTPAMRIRHGADFSRAYREGNRARGGALIVVARANGCDGTRLGLSVGRKVWKSAVKRNRIRRLFREAFRLEYGELPPGHDLVLIPAAPKLVTSLGQVRNELVKLSRKAARRHAEKLATQEGATR